MKALFCLAVVFASITLGSGFQTEVKRAPKDENRGMLAVGEHNGEVKTEERTQAIDFDACFSSPLERMCTVEERMRGNPAISPLARSVLTSGADCLQICHHYF